MKTLKIKINPKYPEKSKISIASSIIKYGGLVAFPTETVYGLGALALNEKAVDKIFRAKGRPVDNPLIVHISDKKQVNKLAKNVSKEAKRLMTKFWPGPLTIVFNKKNVVPDNVSAGLKTVAIRMPRNKIALELIKSCGPIAAPSANLSGKPSGTSFKHVIQDFNGKIDCIIDGGKSNIGIESTVISLASSPPVLLRPGYITLEQLRSYIPDIRVHGSIEGKKIEGKVHSPGMKYKHYSPKAKVILVEGSINFIKDKINETKNKYEKQGKMVFVINIKDKKKLARNLFSLFRKADDKGYDVIILSGVDENNLGFALMNRIRKAASKIIVL